MLSAYLYRIRKQALKKPIILILGLIAVAFSVLMMFYPMLMADDGTIHNNDLVIGGLNLILIVALNFIFFSGLNNGAVGFTNADVNFHLAGPFTPRFNLIIAAAGVLKIAAVFMWVFICQVATLRIAFGVDTMDMFGIVLSSGLVIVIGYALGAFFCTYFDDNENGKKKVMIIAIAIEVVFLLVTVALMLTKYGSFTAIKALGGKGIIAALGATVSIKFFPIAGWIAMIYTGILLKDILYLVCGIVLTVAVFAVIIILFNRFEINYYETALATAQKVADMNEAKKAGIDSDTAKLNQKIKVGKEVFNNGWGASAFFFRHLHENKRASKFFFVNSLALLYRVMCFIYMFIIKFEDPMVTMISGMLMIFLLNAIVFGGGKTVLEFNRPYIYMIPEKGSKKIMNCVLASIPEMVFDSLLCTVMMAFFCGFNAIESIPMFFMFLVFDILCQIIGVLSVRYLRGLGKVLLTLVRYLLIFFVSMVGLVPSIVVGIILKNFAFAFTTYAIIGLVLIALLLIPLSKVIDNAEVA